MDGSLHTIPIAVSFFFFYNAFDLFVAASQDKESKKEKTPVENDDYSSNHFADYSSDYFVDDETSSCGLFEHDDEFNSNPEGKDAAEKGLTAKLFICLTVVFQQSLISSFGLHHCWSASGDSMGLRQQS